MIPQNVHKYMKYIGKKGGEARAGKLSMAARSSQARRAVLSRWLCKRFGTDRFETMGIPGWEIVDSGLRDLVNGNLSSVNALAIAEARPRLRFLGVPVPDVSSQISDSRTLLYHNMEKEHGDMAYTRFCSLLERVNSFCDALSSNMPIPQYSSHRNRRWYA
ncbi:MAG TPA: hypothetical protein VJL87_06585 [Bdellovibrionota bacterium]|nr:hypothetical protein [Bdellovibrionota bacterium]